MKLYEMITEKNWCQDGWGKDQLGRRISAMSPLAVRRCVLGHASYRAIGHLASERDAVFSALGSAVLALFPERVDDRYGAATFVAHFNDHPDTTVEDVLRVCKLADV